MIDGAAVLPNLLRGPFPPTPTWLHLRAPPLRDSDLQAQWQAAARPTRLPLDTLQH